MQLSGSANGVNGWRHGGPTFAFAGVAILLAMLFPTIALGENASGQTSLEPDWRSIQFSDLSTKETARFAIGAAIFAAEWIAAPNVSDGADGLGPLYNSNACIQCHPTRASLAVKVERGPLIRHVLRFDGGKPDGAGDPRYGRQLQDRAIAGQTSEGRIDLQWSMHSVRLRDGSRVELRRPAISVADLAFGPLAAQTRISLRRSPPLEGLGLVVAIAEADIEAGEDPEDRNGDGIRGRAGRSIDRSTGQMRIARFGWKATAITLADQTADAFNLDMGLSSPLSADAAGDCTRFQVACRSAPDGRSAAKDGHEVSAEELSLVVAYLEGLAPPPSSNVDGGGVGRLQFAAIGCGGCHHEAFTTREMAQSPHLSRKPVRLYSDLLLHDMGADLATPGDDLSLYGKSWRTAPLWGLGQRLREIDDGQIEGLLHDGRARSIEEAILWHGGEGEAAREAYRSLSAADRKVLLSYLAGF